MQGVVKDEVQKLSKLYQGYNKQDIVFLELMAPEHLQEVFDKAITTEEMRNALQQRYTFRQAVVNEWNNQHPYLLACMYADADSHTFIQIDKLK
jgi:molybdenum cofactor biosynthesis enzyme MoaA